MPDRAAVKAYLLDLQSRIVAALEAFDGKPFQTDSWTRPAGGGGLTRLIEDGNFFERGGCNFSHVMGAGLPPSATAARPELAGRSYEAMGVSLVLHPRNPYCPTVHMNVRFFIASSEGKDDVWWFGGGMDLTPYYPIEEDVRHFHATCKAAVLPWGEAEYQRLKDWCDRYFFLKHRNEPRGVGGLFFDDLGADGHTASLVPGDASLQVGDADVALSGPYQGHRRMTLTYPVLNRARGVLWLATGADKRAMVARLRSGDTGIPAGRVQAGHAWLLGDAAALG